MNQRELADDLTALLLKSERFDTVRLVGSVAKNAFDEYSDIDMVVASSERNYHENVITASHVVADRYPIGFTDWARSLLPEKCVMNLFLRDTSPFWWIDIGCRRANGDGTIERSALSVDPDQHAAKLWVMNAKYHFRQDHKNSTLDVLYERAFPERPMPADVIQVFEDLYQAIDWSRVESGFGRMCESIRSKLLTSSCTERDMPA